MGSGRVTNYSDSVLWLEKGLKKYKITEPLSAVCKGFFGLRVWGLPPFPMSGEVSGPRSCLGSDGCILFTCHGCGFASQVFLMRLSAGAWGLQGGVGWVLLPSTSVGSSCRHAECRYFLFSRPSTCGAFSPPWVSFFQGHSFNPLLPRRDSLPIFHPFMVVFFTPVAPLRCGVSCPSVLSVLRSPPRPFLYNVHGGCIKLRVFLPRRGGASDFFLALLID